MTILKKLYKASFARVLFELDKIIKFHGKQKLNIDLTKNCLANNFL